MTLVAKCLWVPLLSLAGCNGSSQPPQVGKGVLPATYRGPAISLEPAARRARDLYDIEGFYARAGARSTWLETLPKNHAHWKSGFLELAKDGNTKLSIEQVEQIREVASMLALHDDRNDLDKLMAKTSSMSDPDREKFVVQSMFSIVKDVFSYLGIQNPSKDLLEYTWSMVASRFSDANMHYNSAEGDQYQLRDKRWPTLSEFFRKPEGDCTAISMVPVYLSKIASKVVPELAGFIAMNAGVNRVNDDGSSQGAGHSVMAVKTSGNFVFMFDPAYRGLGEPKRTFPHAPSLTFNGALDPASMSFITMKYDAYIKDDIKKYQGSPPANFSMEFVGGDRSGALLNLGNTDTQYAKTRENFSNASSEVHKLMLQNKLTTWGRLHAWQKQNRDTMLKIAREILKYN